MILTLSDFHEKTFCDKMKYKYEGVQDEYKLVSRAHEKNKGID